MVARPADADGVAHREPVVHVQGAAPARRVAEHAEAVRRAVRGVAAQGVLPGGGALEHQVDVRARRPGGHRGAVDRLQDQGDDAVGDRLLGLDPDLGLVLAAALVQGARGVRGRRRRAVGPGRSGRCDQTYMFGVLR